MSASFAGAVLAKMSWLPLAPLAFLALGANAQHLYCSPVEIRPPGTADIQSGGEHFKFKYTGVVPTLNAPNFVLVIPSSGTTPAGVQIGLNPAVVAELQPGGIG